MTCAEVKIGGSMLVAQADCAPLGLRDVVLCVALAMALMLALDALDGARGRL